MPDTELRPTSKDSVIWTSQIAIHRHHHHLFSHR